LDIVAIAFEIAFELGEREIVSFERIEAHESPHCLERLASTDAAKFAKGPPEWIRDEADEIDVVGRSRDTVSVNEDEASQTMHLNRLRHHPIEVVEEGPPGLGRSFIFRHSATGRA
jgi:hypothetical protein